MPSRDLTDLPDDCLVACLLAMPVEGMVCMRMTCRRLLYLSRRESIWTTIFQRCAGPGFLNITHALNSHRHLLEPLAVYASKLHAQRSDSLHKGLTSAPLGPQAGPLEEELVSASNRRHLSRDARWLVDIQGTWSVQVWDLLYRRCYVDSREMTGEPPSTPVSSVMHVSDGGKQLYVIVHGVREVEGGGSASRPAYESVMYLWTQDVPSQKLYNDPLIFPPHSPYSRSVRWMPRVEISGPTPSSLDLNEDWLSYYVLGTNTVVVTEWTYGLDDPQERRCKGVVMAHDALSRLGRRLISACTRVSSGKGRRYLIWIGSQGTVLLFPVPPLSIAPSSTLETVDVEPIARIDLNTSVVYVSAMRTLIPRDDGPFILSLVSQDTCHTLIIDPSPSEPHRPHIVTISRSIPLSPDHDTDMSLSVIDPTGTSGVFFERDSAMPAVSRLVALTASSPDPHQLPTHPLADPAVPMFCRRVVGDALVGSCEYVAYDEVSGVVCAQTVRTVQPNEPAVRQLQLTYHPVIKDFLG